MAHQRGCLPSGRVLIEIRFFGRVIGFPRTPDIDAATKRGDFTTDVVVSGGRDWQGRWFAGEINAADGRPAIVVHLVVEVVILVQRVQGDAVEQLMELDQHVVHLLAAIRFGPCAGIGGLGDPVRDGPQLSGALVIGVLGVIVVGNRSSAPSFQLVGSSL